MKRRLRTVSGRNRRRLIAEPLEARRVLAASFGWDGPGLGSAELTYTIGNAPSSLSQAEVDRAIETAFNAWASVVDISFTEVNQSGLRDSIDITFRNIDGRGGILAQAYFPDDVNQARIAGDIEFDLAEVWEVGNSRGSRAFDLAWVATHEIGHSLGLDHSRDPGAVLAAYVSPNQQFVALDSDDIAEIRQLYAASAGSVTPNTAAEEPTVTEPADPVTPNESSNPSGEDSNNNDSGDTDNDPFRRWRRWWTWRGFWWRWGGRATADAPGNQNQNSPTDANDDGSTSAVDALVIINHLNRPESSGTGFYDVNGDGTISAADALMVINSMRPVETTPAHEEVGTDDREQEDDELDDCDDDEMDDDDSESESLRMSQRRSDRLFARLGHRVGRR